MKHRRVIAFAGAAIIASSSALAATAVSSTPAFAVDSNFIIHWINLRGAQTTDVACVRGMASPISSKGTAETLNNNCGVRVWVYDPSGAAQCVSPHSAAGSDFAQI